MEGPSATVKIDTECKLVLSLIQNLLVMCVRLELTSFLNVVCAVDSDVTFESTDCIRFFLHRKNLEAHTGAFPAPEFETKGEITPLTEPANVLRILFQFVYPRRQPDLECMDFEVVAAVSEAAEKYEVFSAMPICNVRMRCLNR